MSKHNNTQLELTPHSLSEKQELLLSRYHDGECNFIQSLQAKRLIQRNQSAHAFLQNLRAIQTACIAEANTNEQKPVDLWERVNTRIMQEERAALYLGERRLKQSSESLSSESLWSRLQSPYALAGGLTGAACAALLLMVLYRPTEILSFSAPQTAMLSTMPHVQPVAVQPVGGIGNVQRPRLAPALNQPSLEVDWMRSHGSVKVIPDPNGSSAIIWVRRRQALPSRQPLRALVRSTPLNVAKPTATIPHTEEWLDGSTRPSAK
jgi:hypothetical protein